METPATLRLTLRESSQSALLQPGKNAQGQGDAQGDAAGRRSQDQGLGETLADKLGNRSLFDQGAAQIKAERHA
ncbi:MAG: hypothetical protein V8K32_12470 [Candidatus Electrothrix gigas]